MNRIGRSVLVLALLIVVCGAARAQGGVAPTAPYAATAQLLERFISSQLEKQIAAISVALVDDQEIVWARGFGFARPVDSTPATAETVYRVASVSKLFTDLAVLHLVERGALDLDAPVSRYLPDFRPQNPFDRPVTLRQLLSHRSGLVREPPVGNYFDPTEPTLEATVTSLNRTALVYAPEVRPKYSNAAVAVAGRIIEVSQGEPFAAYMDRVVLRPLGMRQASFSVTPEVRAQLAAGEMWTLDGRRFAAPTFQFGMAPAANLYSSVLDLGRFLSALFAGGRGVVRPETLQEMWRPQFADTSARMGFGLGFYVSRLDDARLVSHDGAVYGFATKVAALPDEKLGVVVVATLDVATTVTERIAHAALQAMRAAKAGTSLPEPVMTVAVPPHVPAKVAGRYVRGQRQIELRARGDELYLVAGRGGVPLSLRSLGDSMAVDDPREFGPYVVPLADGRLRINRDTFAPSPLPKPLAAPARWQALIGEYGWDHNTLYIYESQGVLHTLIEWFFPYALRELADTVFAFPQFGGLYDGERLVFRRGTDGQITEVEAASAVWVRRRVGPEHGNQLRITPRRSVNVLLREARRAAPPVERGRFRTPDFVDLLSLDATIRLDIRYASSNNFLGTAFYRTPRAFLQRPAAEALVRAHRALAPQGYGLLVHDAYRPWYVTRVFWDATPDSLRWLVADPARGSRHNRGAAVDLTLYDLVTGEPIQMVGTYDEATARSLPDYPGGTSLQRWHRDLLRRTMEAEGFTVYESEWWHFDFRDWRQYPIVNRPFEQIR
jgi:CubicO group peptidase (beta-lactamase class C family)/D-alanyl-D-alanine dipeptidase